MMSTMTNLLNVPVLVNLRHKVTSRKPASASIHHNIKVHGNKTKPTLNGSMNHNQVFISFYTYPRCHFCSSSVLYGRKSISGGNTTSSCRLSSSTLASQLSSINQTPSTKIHAMNQSTLSPSSHKSMEDNQSENSALLYKRNPSKSMFPRILLSLSTLHTAYWTWYVYDFTPAIESAISSSAVVAVDVASSAAMDTVTPFDNSTIGYVGLSIAFCMSAGSFIYPKSLIQEIQLKPSNELSPFSSSYSSLEIKTYSLPFIIPSKTPIKYKLGSIIIDSPNDVKSIIEDYDGDLGLYDRGYLPLHADGKRINYLLHLSDNNGDDVNGRLLFQSLVSPELRSILLDNSYDNNDNYNNNSTNSKNGSGTKNPEIESKKDKQRKRRLMRRK